MKTTYSVICTFCVLLSAHAEQSALPGDFFSALRNGEVRQIRAALDKGAPVNARRL